MALIGSKIPQYSLQAYVNGEFKTLTNREALGKWAVYSFYPSDFTFVCSQELVALQEKYEELQDLGAEVYSVSTDSHFVHKAWADFTDTIAKIQFPMLADTAHVLTSGLGVLAEETGMALRASFIVNPEGVIIAYEVHSIGVNRNADELVRKVQTAQEAAKVDVEGSLAQW